MNEFVVALRAAGLMEAGQSEPVAGAVLSLASCRQLLGASHLEPGEFADRLAAALCVPRFKLKEIRSGASLAGEFSPPFLHQSGLYPYRNASGALRLAAADPFFADAIDAIALTLGGAIQLEVATQDEIEIALDAGKDSAAVEEPSFDPAGEESSPDHADSLRDLASGAPVVQALDEILDRAIALRASDIHFEPQKRDLQVRVRVDGVLRGLPVSRSVPARAIVSRIKILSGLNIAEHRQPQDGRMRTKIRGRAFDIRVATMPTTTGESAILRLLDRSGRTVGFDQLGFSSRDGAVLRQKLAEPHGMIIVTGPTGSGKTTTLAAALAVLNDSTRKILTVEDPVEYEIAGISQTQVKPQIGLTFATALRAFLRQDPDVIMVGEIRDPETAKIAIQASLTGHLVMTTLHTNTAASAISRLVDIGIEQFLIASTVTAVVGQRLIRVLCPDCRRRVIVGERDLEEDPRITGLGLGPGTVLHQPVGCERCGNTGYRGRQALFEVLDVTEPVRRQILARGDDGAIERAAKAEGMTRLVDDGLARCLQGVTSIDEVFRVAAAH